jgi:hypothetical protein
MSEVRSQWAVHASLAALGLLCAIGMWRVVAGIGLHVPLDPNEGWNAYHAAAAMSGHALYPGAHAYLVNNYPPLSYYIVGLLGLLVGDNIVAGRIVSLLSLAAIAWGMMVAARRMGASRTEAVLPPLLFAAGLLLFTDYAGMDDPQMLAHAVATSGLVVLLAHPRTTKILAVAALLFVLAFFVKHAVVAMPIAATIWLFLRDRRSALRLAGFGIAFLVLGLIMFRLTYGVSLLSVIATARSYSFEALREGLLAWLRWSGVLFIGLAALLWLRRNDPFVQLCAIYTGIATATGAVFLGGAGVDPNVLFDADIALALSAALLIATFRGWQRAALVAVYAAPLLFFAVTNEEWLAINLQRHPLRAEATVAGQDIAFMSERKGPALCEMLSFCYWSGKPPAVDVFNVGQQFETKTRSDAELVREVDAKRFAVIQFDPDSPYSLGEDIHNAMARAYRVHHVDEFGTFYVPRTPL